MLRTLTQSEIAEVLDNNHIGRLGFRDGDRIYITPVHYHYDYNLVLCQSYEGLKISLMRQHPDVCFEVEEFGTANDWKMVIGWGLFEELVQPDDIADARSRMADVLLAQKAGLATPPPSGHTGVHTAAPGEIVYYRIRLNELSGRMETRL